MLGHISRTGQFQAECSDMSQVGRNIQSVDRNMLYANGAFKLANPLVNFLAVASTEQWSALAPRGVLMRGEPPDAHR